MDYPLRLVIFSKYKSIFYTSTTILDDDDNDNNNNYNNSSIIVSPSVQHGLWTEVKEGVEYREEGSMKLSRNVESF